MNVSLAATPAKPGTKAFLEELRALSPSDAERVWSLLEQLGKNPSDMTVLRTASAKSDLFASRIADRLYRLYLSILVI